MSHAEILLTIVSGMAVNECSDVCPCLARALTGWSVRLRYPNPEQALVRGEELQRHIDDRPGKLLKLGTALSFLAVGAAEAVCRTVLRRGAAPAGTGTLGLRDAAVDALARRLRGFEELRTLRARDRRRFRSLSARLAELVRCPAPEIDGGAAERLLQAVVTTGNAMIDDRNELGALALTTAAQHHADRFGPRHPAVLPLRFTSARADLQLGRPGQAELLLRALLRDCTEVLGAGHPLVFDTRRNLAWALTGQDRLAEAEHTLRGLLADMSRAAVRPRELRLHARCMLSWVIARAGRLAEAEAGYADVGAEREHLLGSEHPDTLDTRHSLAKVILERDPQRAHAEFRQVAAARRAICGADHPDTLESRKYAALTLVLADPRHPARARRELRPILKWQVKKLGEDHPNTVHTREQLARLKSGR